MEVSAKKTNQTSIVLLTNNEDLSSIFYKFPITIVHRKQKRFILRFSVEYTLLLIFYVNILVLSAMIVHSVTNMLKQTT